MNNALRWHMAGLLLVVGCLCSAAEAGPGNTTTGVIGDPAASTDPATASDRVVPAAADTAAWSVLRCIDYAVLNAPAVREQRLQVDVAQLAVTIERARFRPQFSGDLQRSLDDDTTQWNGSVDQELPAGFDLSLRGAVDDLDDANADTVYSVRLSKKLLGGGSWEATFEALNDSVIDAIIADNQFALERRQVEVRVRRAYYDLLSRRQTLAIQRSQLAAAENNLALTRERDDLLDIANAEIQVNQARSAVVRAEQAVDNAADGLKSTMGYPIPRPIRIVQQVDFALADIEPDADIAWSLANNEEFLNLALREQKQTRDISVSSEKRWPDVSIDGTYRRQVDDERFGWAETDEDVTIGLSLDWEWMSMSDRARHQQALIRGQLLEVERFRRTQDKIQALRDLQRRLQQLRMQVELAEQEVELQERRTALYRDRYENGEIGILEFIRNQDALDRSRVDLVSQQASYLTTLAEYRFQVGR